MSELKHELVKMSDENVTYDVKRFRVGAGFMIKTVCRACGRLVTREFDRDDYINAFDEGDWQEFGFYMSCDKCGDEWIVPCRVKVDVTLELKSDTEYGDA